MCCNSRYFLQIMSQIYKGSVGGRERKINFFLLIGQLGISHTSDSGAWLKPDFCLLTADSQKFSPGTYIKYLDYQAVIDL